VERQWDVDVAGGPIRVTENGSGPPVLLLHGGPGLSDYTFTLAPELEDGYRVVRFQQRGLAPSTTEGPFDVERHIADALAVLDALDIARACVVGSSWGGHLALHLVAGHEERFSGLVPVDPLGAVGDGGEADLGRLLGERVPAELAAQAAAIDELAMAGGGSAEDALRGLALVWPAYFATPDTAPPMSVTGISLECYARTWDSIHDHLARRTLQERLPSVRLPAVFVLGAQSPIPPEHGEATAALIPGARCQIEPDCGHFVWLERPGAVRTAVDAVHAQI
jgi:proline iminopeptidase